MKNTLHTLLLLILFGSTCLSAQSVGIRAGYVTTGINFEIDADFIDITELDTERRSGVMLGLFLDLPLAEGLLSLQPEINYLNRGATITDTGFGDEVTIAFSNLDVGALLRVNLARENPLSFYLGAGPAYSYALNGEFQFEDDFSEDIDFDDDESGVNRTGLFLTGVAGMNFTNLSSTLIFFAEARYQAGLRDVFDDVEDEILKSKQNLFGISAGIQIPFGRPVNR